MKGKFSLIASAEKDNRLYSCQIYTMFSKKSIYAVLLCFMLVSLSSWGYLVHKTINQIAIYNLPEPLRSFFYKDKLNLIENSPRPDTRRNGDKSEAPKHIIDIEKYGENAINEMPLDFATAIKKYSFDTLAKYGYGPYAVVLEYEKLVNAFKSGNKDSILFHAADLGHYIGDINTPLHTTMNYDGQLTNQKGMHSLWETNVPEYSLTKYQLYNNHKATFLKDPAASIWEATRKSFAQLPAMFAIEKEVSIQFTPETKYSMQMRYGRMTRVYTKEFAAAYSNGISPMVNEQLIASANLLTDFWYTAWVNAGKPPVPFSKDARNNDLKTELNSFKKNQLFIDGLLISKKGKPED